MRGTIGAFPVVLQLTRRYDDGVGGIYYYARKGDGISLDGRMKGDSLVLEEKNEDFETTAVFRGTVHAGAYGGIWTTADAKRSLPFAVKNE